MMMTLSSAKVVFSGALVRGCLAFGVGVGLLAGTLAPQGAQAAAGAAALSAATGQSSGAGDQVVLVPHEAVYKMSLATVASSAGIVGAGGSIRYSFNDACDGWTVETHTDLTMLQTQGEPIRTAWDLLSWESKDGKSYRFHVRNMRNGEVIEAYEGEAELAEDGSGTAHFRLPESDPISFDLPPNTRLPVTHTHALLQQALRGKPFLSVPVFDGSAVQGAFLVSAVLGKTKVPPPHPIPMAAEPPAQVGPAADKGADKGASPTVDLSLLQEQAWPVTLAFFDPTTQAETPIFEVHLDYYRNGVTDSLLQDFGNFSLKGRLTSLKALPKPQC